MDRWKLEDIKDHELRKQVESQLGDDKTKNVKSGNRTVLKEKRTKSGHGSTLEKYMETQLRMFRFDYDAQKSYLISKKYELSNDKSVAYDWGDYRSVRIIPDYSIYQNGVIHIAEVKGYETYVWKVKWRLFVSQNRNNRMTFDVLKSKKQIDNYLIHLKSKQP